MAGGKVDYHWLEPVSHYYVVPAKISVNNADGFEGGHSADDAAGDSEPHLEAHDGGGVKKTSR